MDFIHDTLCHGKRSRTPNVTDEGVREVPTIEVVTSPPAERVIRALEQLKESRPLPARIRVANGPELVSSKLVAWCDDHRIRLHHVQPGRPTQNGYIERFNKSFRNEVLNANLFGSLSEAREATHVWMASYNEERPHKSPGNLPPTLYRQQLTNTEPGRQNGARGLIKLRRCSGWRESTNTTPCQKREPEGVSAPNSKPVSPWRRLAG